MVNTKLITATVTVAAIFAIGCTAIYKTVYANKDNGIRVLDYKAPKEVNERCYQINKHENVNALFWLNENKILAFRNDYYDDFMSDESSRNSISTYDLNTKEYVDYNKLDINPNRIHGVSPSGRYVLYSEPRNIPRVESEDWKQAISNGDIFTENVDILDLQTGDVIKRFDKNGNNYEAQYEWLSDGRILVNYGSVWEILNFEGETIKEGKYNFDGYDCSYATLIDVKELKDLNGEISGSFYYSKEIMGADKNLGIDVYSMDVNTLEEKFIFNSKHSSNCYKRESIFVASTFENNGGAVNGEYVNRTFGLNIFKENSSLLQNINFEKGRINAELALSPNGSKLAFKEIENDMFNDKSMTLNDSIKLVDIKSGNISEVLKVDSLIDKINEEQFISYKVIDDVNVKTIKAAGPKIFNLAWDSSSTSLMFNYKYTSKEDGKNYIDTYVLTYDN